MSSRAEDTIPRDMRSTAPARPSLGVVGGTAGTRKQEDEGSVGNLLRQLAHDVPELLIKELALARAEMTQALRETKAGIAGLMVGAAVLLTGLGVLAMAAVYGLSNVMEPWLAALIVGGAIVLVGTILLMSGKSKLSASHFKPERTLEQIHRDKNTATRRTA